MPNLELKPCPRCGKKVEIKEEYDTLQVICPSCGNKGEKYDGDYYDEGFMMQIYGDKAIEQWNRMEDNE